VLNISYLWETRVSKNQGENQQVLKQGIVSAIEYQWSHQGYALGIEDMFVVGPKYGTKYYTVNLGSGSVIQVSIFIH
jgi:hypothetical protein